MSAFTQQLVVSHRVPVHVVGPTCNEYYSACESGLISVVSVYRGSRSSTKSNRHDVIGLMVRLMASARYAEVNIGNKWYINLEEQAWEERGGGGGVLTRGLTFWSHIKENVGA